MEILVVGNETSLKECRLKFGATQSYTLAESDSQIGDFLKKDTVVFDFQVINSPARIEVYKNFSEIVFLNVSRNSLAGLTDSTSKAKFFGFCGLPTFLNREILEVSISKQADQAILQGVCGTLCTEFAIVKDQVGLVTPRVICMIINEAYFAIQENIASRGDIDLAMKLGTNYPYGPFEWCERIGIKNVFELLSAVLDATHDERYRVCELLKKEALS